MNIDAAYAAAVRAAVTLVRTNLNAVLFLVGFVTFIVSVAQWSGPAAGAIAGSVLMLIAAWPYVQLARKKS